MINKIFTTSLFLLALAACTNQRTTDSPKPETPKALEDHSASYDIISKRGYEDLIESLYEELLSKNMDLRQLEDKMDELNKNRRDSSLLFDKYNEKNQSYYNAAERHIAGIKDSLLRDKMKGLIANNLKTYDASIAKHTALLKLIEAKNLSISDLHTMLKIVKTLPLIEKYQKENLPNTKSLEGYIKRQDESIKLADSLLKK